MKYFQKLIWLIKGTPFVSVKKKAFVDKHAYGCVPLYFMFNVDFGHTHLPFSFGYMLLNSEVGR
jgi:hypothetical protein